MLGTQDKTFNRLIKEVSKLVEEKVINEEVIVQCGNTNVKVKNLKMFKFLNSDELNKYIVQSKYIITHGGVGSILDCLNNNKKVIAVARRSKYNEHVNDHQVQIIEEFTRLNYILGCKDVSELADKISLIDEFSPSNYESNNENFVNLIDSFLQDV